MVYGKLSKSTTFLGYLVRGGRKGNNVEWVRANWKFNGEG